MAIDWDALGEIQDGNFGWRSAFPELSEVYVPGEGDNPIAVIIGEAPGAQEETKRRPFVGTSGAVLRQLMDTAGLWATDLPDSACPDANCWLTNVVKFRPPKNRKPTPLEIKAARPWLRMEWEAIGKPRLIIPIGSTALEAVFGRWVPLHKVSGRVIMCTSREGLELAVWPMLHPSFGLRNPVMQPLLEQDWSRLRVWLNMRKDEKPPLAVEFSHAELFIDNSWVDITANMEIDKLSEYNRPFEV